MTDLQIVLRQLQHEIQAALVDSGAPPEGVHLEAESATLTLQLETDPEAGSGAADPPRLRLARADRPTTGGIHSLTVEFRIRPPSSTPAPESAGAEARSGSGSPGMSGASEDSIAAACERVFGAPGFDNSARAEVFCEWAAGEESGAIQALLDAMTRGEKMPPNSREAARMTRLRRLLEFAPGGPVAAAEVLRELMLASSLETVLGVLARRWHFGTHWVLPEESTGN